MNQVRKLFRLRFLAKLSQRDVALAIGCGKTTVLDYEAKARSIGITKYSDIEVLSDEELVSKLKITCTKRATGAPPRIEKVNPNCANIFLELKRKNVTKRLLWEEYLQDNPSGYRYTQFCEQYRSWLKSTPISMRINHIAGEKVFVDYAGTAMEIIDQSTGEIEKVQIFVGALGASSYIFAEATMSQSSRDWQGSHRRMLEYFGGVPEIIVPDNLKSGVTKSSRYEPVLNLAYENLSKHYDFCIVPARAYKPKDKAKAEVSVLVVSRWIIAALRKQNFYSLYELNEAIKLLLEKVNNRKMRHIGKSRQELFIELDKLALKRLPETPYEVSELKQARVNIDYHIEFDKNFYSVPYQTIGELVTVRATDYCIEIYSNSKRIASHKRTYRQRTYCTSDDHRPKSHQEHLKWNPQRIQEWATSKGEIVGELIELLFQSKRHPEQAYRSALGIIRLGDKYGDQRLREACRRAVELQAPTYRTISNLLKNKMEQATSIENKQQLELLQKK